MHNTEEELIVNVDALSRDKFQVAVDDIIEISVPDDAASRYVKIPPPPPPPPPKKKKQNIMTCVPESNSSSLFRSRVCLQVTSVPQDIQTKGDPLNVGCYMYNVMYCVSMAIGGPLSVGKELAQLYNLEGVKEVNVRKVDKDEVGIDLLELKFKVHSFTMYNSCPVLCLSTPQCCVLPVYFVMGEG